MSILALRTLKGDKLGLLNERAQCSSMLERTRMLLHGSKTLFRILQMCLKKTSDSISELLVGKAFIELKSMASRNLTNLRHQVVVESLLLFRLPLLSRKLIIVTHRVVQYLFARWILFPVETFTDDKRRRFDAFFQTFFWLTLQGHTEN